MHDFSFCDVLAQHFPSFSVSQFMLTFDKTRGCIMSHADDKYIQWLVQLICTFRKHGMVAAPEDLFKNMNPNVKSSRFIA